MWSFEFNNQNKKITLPSGREIVAGAIGKIYYRKSEPGIALQYSTYLDIEDLKSLQNEVDEIWSLFKPRADESGLNSAVISVNSPPPTGIFFIGVQKNRKFAFIKTEEELWQPVNSRYTEAEIEDFQVKFGAIENRNDVSLVFEDSTSLPLLTKDTGFYYGFTILPSNNEPYNYHCHFYPPETAQFSCETGEIVREIASSDNSQKGFRLPTRRTQGISTTPMWFDPGDPPGEYRIEVYINDNLVEGINFMVYKPE